MSPRTEPGVNIPLLGSAADASGLLCPLKSKRNRSRGKTGPPLALHPFLNLSPPGQVTMAPLLVEHPHEAEPAVSPRSPGAPRGTDGQGHTAWPSRAKLLLPGAQAPSLTLNALVPASHRCPVSAASWGSWLSARFLPGEEGGVGPEGLASSPPHPEDPLCQSPGSGFTPLLREAGNRL